jgi:hypothetical protein
MNEAGVPPLRTVGSYEANVARCQFVALRLARLWAHPDRTLALTALMSLILVAPTLLPHLTHLRSLRTYERLRWEKARQVVFAAEALTQHAVADRLAAFPQVYVSHLSIVPHLSAPRSHAPPSRVPPPRKETP